MNTAQFKDQLIDAGLNGDVEIIRWGSASGHVQMRAVHFEGGPRFNVVCDTQRATDVAAETMAALPGMVAALIGEVDRLRAEVAKHPEVKTRLLGVGCVRQRDGRLWLLNRADGGWSSFGMCIESWDELLRVYDVTVGDPKVDEHGQWWPVKPRRP